MIYNINCNAFFAVIAVYKCIIKLINYLLISRSGDDNLVKFNTKGGTY